MISWSWLQVHGRGSHDSHGILLAVSVYTAIFRRIPATVDGVLRGGPAGLPGGLMSQLKDLLKRRRKLPKKLEDTPPVSPKRTLQQVLKA